MDKFRYDRCIDGKYTCLNLTTGQLTVCTFEELPYEEQCKAQRDFDRRIFGETKFNPGPLRATEER
jgi:hypothetical protein